MSRPRLDPERAHRILLVRTSALGDVVHALPVLAALRAALPNSRLGWVVDEAFAPLLERHGLIDELFPVPLRRWRRPSAGQAGRARELATFVRRLRRFDAEIAIDLMGNTKAAVIARLSGAPRRIGADRGSRREAASAVLVNDRVTLRTRHAVERGLELLAPLGIAAGSADFAPGQLACGREAIPAGDFVFLHPGAAWANKRYPPALWGEVAAELAARSGCRVLVGAAPGEEALAEAVVAASRGGARRHDAPSLAALAGALRGARLVLAADTGATHLARALGVPVVAVHGPTDPARHGPWPGRSAVVVRQLPCSFCHRRMAEAKLCLAAIPPREIVERALDLLAAPV